MDIDRSTRENRKLDFSDLSSLEINSNSSITSINSNKFPFVDDGDSNNNSSYLLGSCSGPGL